MPITAHFIVVYNRIPELIAAVEASSRSAPMRVAEKVVRSARGRAPVDTGELKGSIHAVSIERGKVAEVQVDAAHGPYVEYGTYKMPAQPFLNPAFQEHAKELCLEIVAPLNG